MQKLSNKKSLELKKAFKKIISSKIIFASIFLIIGSLITYSCQQHQDSKSYQKKYHSHFFHNFDEDFEEDFFADFNAMHERMERSFKNHRQTIRQAFQENNKILENSESSKIQASLQHFEDEKSHNFELKFVGIKPEEINVLIEKNYLIFSSKKTDIVSAKNEEQSIQSSSNADFYYANYLPEYDEKISPEIIKNNEKISVKLFKKIVKNSENSAKKICQSSIVTR